MLNPYIKIENLEISFEKKIILKNFNYQYNGYGIVLVLGPNGVGKTSFLKVLGGLQSANSGRIDFKINNLNKNSLSEMTSLFASSSGLLPEWSGKDHLRWVYLLNVNKHLDEGSVMNLFRDVNFLDEILEKKLR